MRTRMRGSFFFALFTLLLAGCGGVPGFDAPNAPRAFTAAQVFNPTVGEVWSFTNGYGDITKVSVESAPFDAAGTQGSHFVLHFSKTADRAYWGIGIPQAEDRFVLYLLPDGTWRGVADLPNFPQGCAFCEGHTSATLNWHPVAGMPAPYQIVPGKVIEGDVTVITTQYDWWELWDTTTTDDIADAPAPGTHMGNVSWESRFYTEQVSTPVYTGVAVVSEQHEGCIEERWYFAPKLGLVQIISLVGSDCRPTDENLAMKRTN